MADVKIIFFLAALAIVITILNTFLKQAGRDEYAFLTLIIGIAIALIKVLPVILDLFTKVEDVFRFF